MNVLSTLTYKSCAKCWGESSQRYLLFFRDAGNPVGELLWIVQERAQGSVGAGRRQLKAGRRGKSALPFFSEACAAVGLPCFAPWPLSMSASFALSWEENSERDVLWSGCLCAIHRKTPPKETGVKTWLPWTRSLSNHHIAHHSGTSCSTLYGTRISLSFSFSLFLPFIKVYFQSFKIQPYPPEYAQ